METKGLLPSREDGVESPLRREPNFLISAAEVTALVAVWVGILVLAQGNVLAFVGIVELLRIVLSTSSTGTSKNE